MKLALAFRCTGKFPSHLEQPGRICRSRTFNATNMKHNYLQCCWSFIKACIPGVLWEQICCQIWFQHIKKTPCANFWSNWGNQWRMTVYCDCAWLHVQAIDWLLIDWLIDKLIDWLINCWIDLGSDYYYCQKSSWFFQKQYSVNNKYQYPIPNNIF